MPGEFLIARNPDPDSSLPYLLRLPLGRHGIVLKARETWPRTAKLYCHPAPPPGWPAEPDVVERTPVRSCVRRGPAIDLVLDRARERRSQFVFTRARGRPVIFWQSARTNRQARPAVALPTARASTATAGPLTILVDTREHRPWRFSAEHAATRRMALPVGDYAVLGHRGDLVAVVERKTLLDLVATVVARRLEPTLADLAAAPRAALVVEDRWSAVFRLEHVRPSLVANALARGQVTVPHVPIVFAETRPLAQEWTYRFFGAALDHDARPLDAAWLQAELPLASGDASRP